MNVSYKKLINKESVPVLKPTKKIPFLVCPVCTTINASMCSNCGSFYCNRCSNGIYYHYNNKEGVIKDGHDPVCMKKELTASDIADEVCERLGKMLRPEKSIDEEKGKDEIQEPEKEIEKKSNERNSVREWRQSHLRDFNLPDSLQKSFLGIPATQAKELYENVRIFSNSDSNFLTSDYNNNRLNLLCNDEEAKIIMQVVGFF